MNCIYIHVHILTTYVFQSNSTTEQKTSYKYVYLIKDNICIIVNQILHTTDIDINKNSSNLFHIANNILKCSNFIGNKSHISKYSM